MPIILATQEVQIRKIQVQGQIRQKVGNTPTSSSKPGIVTLACHPSYTGNINKRRMV
jgi:hypothetical protein